MGRIRAWVYKRGFRPKPGSIFYSLSIALNLALQEGQRLFKDYLYLAHQHISFADFLKWGGDPIPQNGRYYSRADEVVGNVPKED